MSNKGDNIRTRWHRCQEAFTAGRVQIKTGQSTPARHVYPNTRPWDEIETFMQIVDGLPKYYVEPSMMEICGRPEVTKSLEAMHTAKIDRLPFPDILVEVEGKTKQGVGTVRNMIMLHERQSKDLHPAEQMYHPFRAVLFRLVSYQGTDHLIFSPSTYWLTFDPNADDHAGGTGFGIHYMTGPAPYVEHGVETMRQITDIGMADFLPCKDAFEAMMVLLNTRGVHKEVIIPERLNKARHKARKVPIPRHTVIRVAHCYSRDGTKREVPGWKQQFHIRPGYINYYWYGKRKGPDAHPELRPKYVEPYFVNWDPENPEAVPKVPEAHLRA